jgi:mannitol/fructose-specific phosphotransferase system IIA component (Ntr-type)
MTTIDDILSPDHVALQLKATTSDEAITEVAALLKRDVRVLDWEELHACFRRSAPCPCEPELGFSICIPHARTESITEMVMAVGRVIQGIPFPTAKQPARYLFCIAVPTALAADYLRIVGLIARVFKDPQIEEQLRTVQSPAEFIEILARAETKL